MGGGAPAQGCVVLVDDSEPVLDAMGRLLEPLRLETLTFYNAADALAALAERGLEVDAVVSDLRMPGLDGMGLLEQVRDRWPELPVIMMTGHATVKSAVEAMRLGAYDYLVKPFPVPSDVIETVRRAVEWKRLKARNAELERQVDAAVRGGIVGASAPMQEAFEALRSVAPTDATVLLLGESGTGKELFARAIHDGSSRKNGPFLPVNCSALTDELLASELFGHVRGAFSGAQTSKRGLFEVASGGTLFLDEIGDISAAMQVGLLRALESGEIKPVGSTDNRTVDTRIVAATNRDLLAATTDGSFREDLYYRLNVFAIELPPLRRRAADIPLLVHHLLDRHAEKIGKTTPKVDDAVMAILEGYKWPGNVRELDNVVQRMIVLLRGDVVTPNLLPPAIRGSGSEDRGQANLKIPFTEAKARVLYQFEKSYVERMLRSHKGNLARAARESGLDKANFRRVVKRCEIDLEEYREK